MDLLSVGKLREYAAANAEEWYRFVNDNQRCAREARNGDLRLVMGCDKAKTWGMATFTRSSSETSFQLNFKPLGHTGQMPETYEWDCSGIAEGRTGPSLREVEASGRAGEPQNTILTNQCLFIRTLNISLQSSIWERLEASLFSTVDTGNSWVSGKSDNLNLLSNDTQKAWQRGSGNNSTMGLGFNFPASSVCLLHDYYMCHSESTNQYSNYTLRRRLMNISCERYVFATNLNSISYTKLDIYWTT